jgi:hypothetical protein
MKRIPYGISNFKEVMDKGMYYIDKTKFIEIMELKNEYQFFIRPRRFGKSLFISMLQTYYDMKEKDNFNKYFGEFYIGRNKTKFASSYIILKLSFANVISNQGRERLTESFDNIVAMEVSKCLSKYSDILNEKTLPKEYGAATYALQYLVNQADLKGQKIMLLIDEYDNFANNIMIRDRRLYEDLLHGDGYIKTFYKGIKEGTADGVISKIFVTGVSPIMLDDITSGANIFTITSNDKNLNSMMGFTYKEVEELLEYYKIHEIVDKVELMELLKVYCDGYKFNEEVEETLYNTDMVLYLLNNIIQKGGYPKKLIDENVKTDYTRLRNIAENFITREEMMEIIENGKTDPIEIKDRFNLESLYAGEDKEVNLKSMLYYMGMFTIDKTDGNKTVLKIPNYAIKSLYWDYMNKAYEIEQSASYKELASAMKKMRTTGEIQDIMEIYIKVVNRMSTRDLLHFNEASCKSIFITLVHTDGMYLIESEKEADGGYSDVYIKENVLYKKDINYRYILEFKHIRQGDLQGNFNELSEEEIIALNKEYIDKKQEEAEAQLERYIKDHNIIHDSEKSLKKVIVITIGRRYTLYKEI